MSCVTNVLRDENIEQIGQSYS